MRSSPDGGSPTAHLAHWLGRRRSVSRSRRGQSLVEFALIFPLLMVLFLGAADFGRVFSAGIVLEAAARDSAEVVANDTRMANLKDPACDQTCRDPIYTALHQRAVETACQEASRLASTTPQASGSCANLLVVGVCIHDSLTAQPNGTGDPSCGVASGETPPIAGCPAMSSPWSSGQTDGVNGASSSDGTPQLPLRYVEVRLCYEFKPLYAQIGMPIVSWLKPSIPIQRTRTFTVSADY